MFAVVQSLSEHWCHKIFGFFHNFLQLQSLAKQYLTQIITHQYIHLFLIYHLCMLNIALSLVLSQTTKIKLN